MADQQSTVTGSRRDERTARRSSNPGEDDVTQSETTPGGSTQTMRSIVGGSTGEAFVGLGAAVLAILGLAGVLPMVLAAVAAIGIGAAFLFQGAALSARYSDVLSEAGGDIWPEREVESGLTAEFTGGLAGIALGILALIGVSPMTLLPVAALVFGGTLLLGSGVTSRMNVMARRETGVRGSAAIRRAVSGAAGAQVLVGLGSITLGILGLVLAGANTLVLTLIAFLAVGAAELLGGSAIAGRMVRTISH